MSRLKCLSALAFDQIGDQLLSHPDTALGRIYEYTAQLRRAYRRRSKLCTSNADLFLPLLSVGLAARSAPPNSSESRNVLIVAQWKPVRRGF